MADDSGTADAQARDSRPALLGFGLTVSAAARTIGVAPGTLRTWDHRYGLGPTEHHSGTHRRYSDADLARLQTMRRLTLQGVPAAQAAAIANSDGLGSPTNSPIPAFDLSPGRQTNGAVKGATPEPPSSSPASRQAASGKTRVQAGTSATGATSATRARTPSVPGGFTSGQVRGLVRAAMALDAPSVTEMVTVGLHSQGAWHTWESLCCPALYQIGDHWAQTGTGVEVEHLASGSIATALDAYAYSLAAKQRTAPVLLACASEEQHSLPLAALAAALAESGVVSRTLGARVTAQALSDAVARLRPGAVFVWSQLPTTGDVGAVPSMHGLSRPTPALVLGGPGWSTGALNNPDVRRVHDLPEAVSVLVSSVGGLTGEGELS